jgi:hypothetical protein
MEIALFGAFAGFYLITFGAATVWESARRAVEAITEEI